MPPIRPTWVGPGVTPDEQPAAAGVPADAEEAATMAVAATRASVAAAAAVAPHGVLVSLGGDIAVAGPPPADGWPVGIADGHDRGAKIIARALRDAGMEVIYTGLHQTPEQIVETALQEDADAVGISILSGAHMTLVPRILDLLKQNDAEDVLVVVGGTIPAEDIVELKKLGVAQVYTPGAPTAEIVEFLQSALGAA